MSNLLRRRDLLLMVPGALVLPSIARAAAAAPGDWPEFRGAGAAGVQDGFPLPARWNLRWKTPVQGLGHSSPIVWGDRIYTLTAVRESGEAPLRLGLFGDSDGADDNGTQRWVMYGLDKSNGKVAWERTARRAVPRTQRHRKATQANTTLTTDGTHLVAFFGAEGLYCYKLDGELRWTKDLGAINVSKYGVGWGYASSPALHDGTILLQCDAPEAAFLAAFRASDGSELWRTPRSDLCERCWATPFVHTQDGRTQVVANGWPFVASYDFRTGKELWRLKAGGDNPIPTPFAAHGFIYVANGHGAAAPVWASARSNRRHHAEGRGHVEQPRGLERWSERRLHQDADRVSRASLQRHECRGVQVLQRENRDAPLSTTVAHRVQRVLCFSRCG